MTTATALLVLALQTAPMVEVDPMKCWWQTSKGAITVGEAFDLAITCAAIENETVQVIPDESRLAVASIQLAPFEILGGSHPADTRSGGRRFLQYRYSLRLIDPSAFAADVKVPPQQIHYRVQTQVAADAALQGRDLVYILPAIPLRVLSQVPAEADDIRDGNLALLERAGILRGRAGLLEIASLALVAIGAVLALAAIIRAAGGATWKSATAPGRVPDSAVWRAVSAELEEMQRRSHIEGWPPELLAGALSATRIVAAGVAGGNARQQALSSDVEVTEGRLAVRCGWWKKTRVSVSSSAVSGLPALDVLTKAAYGQQPSTDRAAIDDAVAGALEAARRLVRERTGPVVWLRARLSGLRG